MAKPVGKPTLSLSPWLPVPGKIWVPRFIASLSGLPEGATAEITLWECDESNDGTRRPDRQLGKFTGPVVRSAQPDPSRMGIKPDAPLPTKAQALGKGKDTKEEGDRASSMLVCIATSAGKELLDGYYLLKSDLDAFQQGDYWEVYAKADVSFAGQTFKLISPVVRLEHVPLQVPMGQATYPPRVGNRLRLYNDGCEDDTFQKGALADMVQAIRDAKQFVFVADWSFHPLFRPTRHGKGEPRLDETIGMELIKKARAGVTTAVLTWDHVAVIMPDAQNDDGDDYLADLADDALVALTHVADSNSTLNPDLVTVATAVGSMAAAAALDIGGGAIQKKMGGRLGGLAGELHKNQAIAVGVIAAAGALGSLAKGSTRLPTNLFWRKVSRSGLIKGTTNSHHQKMLIVDYEENDGRRGIRAFLGGLDLTEGRLDHSGHPVAPHPDPKKGAHGKGDESTWAYAQEWGVKKGSTDEWYNAETDGDRTLPRQPWHDVHAKLEGPSAWDYLREFVGRWLTASGGEADDDAIWKAYRGLLKRRLFWSSEEPLPDGPWTVQVCRSLAKVHWQPKLEPLDANIDANMDSDCHASLACRFTWGPKDDYEKSIMLAYQRGIDEARRFIYIENQYFIGSGKRWGFDAVVNDIPERIVNKIIERHAAGKPFHAYIVMPMFPEGGMSRANNELRSYQWRTTQWMITRLCEVMGADWDQYLSFYFLANWKSLPPAEWRTGGDRHDRMRAHQRYMIYVHTKMMIVDDLHLVLGSCNLNDRGLTGNDDSEIVISAWPRLKEVETCKKDIQDLRERLWTEHLGPQFPVASWQTPESASCIKAIKRAGWGNYAAFREMRRTGSEGHLCLWNYVVTPKNTITLKTNDKDLNPSLRIRCLEDNVCLPDAEYMSERKALSKGWCWQGEESWLIPGALVK